MKNIEEIVTDADIESAWQNADFGNSSKREIIIYALRHFSQGFPTGSTLNRISSDLGLTRDVNGITVLSEKGYEYLKSNFSLKEKFIQKLYDELTEQSKTYPKMWTVDVLKILNKILTN